MLSAAIIFAIALAIFLGYKTKINTGLFCIVFAYIIGCFVMGLKPKQVIAYWPTNTMFVWKNRWNAGKYFVHFS